MAADYDFIAPIWARRKVGYLLDQIRLNGESAEVKDELIHLARDFSIATPLHQSPRRPRVLLERRSRQAPASPRRRRTAPSFAAIRRRFWGLVSGGHGAAWAAWGHGRWDGRHGRWDGRHGRRNGRRHSWP